MQRRAPGRRSGRGCELRAGRDAASRARPASEAANGTVTAPRACDAARSRRGAVRRRRSRGARRACPRGAPSRAAADPGRRTRRPPRASPRRSRGRPPGAPPVPASHEPVETDADGRAAHSAVSTCSQGALASVPVPRPCSSATGQHAYATQWTARQARSPSRARTRLVTTGDQQVERERAEAEPERPVRRGERDDRVEACKWANGSSSAVRTCAASSTTTSSDRLRCRPSTRNLGSRADGAPAQRTRDAEDDGRREEDEGDRASAAAQVPERWGRRQDHAVKAKRRPTAPRPGRRAARQAEGLKRPGQPCRGR